MNRLPTCSICIESLGDFSDVGAYRCGHVFHHQCLSEWKKLQPVCPTCKRCFQGRRSSSITKLYFSFDADSQAAEANASRNVEHLKAQLAKAEAELTQMREGRDAAKLALVASKEQLRKVEAARSTAENALKNERGEKAVLEENVKDLKRKLRPVTASRLNGRHIVIRNLSNWVRRRDIKDRLSKRWGVEYVGIEEDLADVVLKYSGDVNEVMDWLEEERSFGRRTSVSHANPKEVDNLQRRRLFVTNISSTLRSSDVEELFYKEDFSVDSVYCVYSHGEFQGEVIVYCCNKREADRIMQLFDDKYIAGSYLRLTFC